LIPCPIVVGESAVQIAKRAKQQATLGGYDVYMLDTAGRLQIDETLMQEVQDVRDAVEPRETLLRCRWVNRSSRCRSGRRI
jgi:signal recognition particle subunit SRP54